MKSALTNSTMICALVEVSSKRAVEDAGDTQDETRIEEGAEGLTQKVADDILLGEEYENMTTADAKVRALPGSAVTVEIVQAPSKDVLAKLEQHTRYGCTAWIPFYALQSIRSIILSTGSCAVKVVKGLVVRISLHSGWHNQRVARNAS